MKKTLRTAALLTMVVILMAFATGCAKADVKKVIKEFETACRSLDFMGMLDCMDPAIAEPVKGILMLFGANNTDSMLDEVVSLLGIFGDLGSNAETAIQSVSIKPENYMFNDAKDACTVTAALTVETEESSVTRNVTVELILKEEQWYIRSMQF